MPQERAAAAAQEQLLQQSISAAPPAVQQHGDEQHLPADAAHVLEAMRVVLVAPKTPANIGAVARACANFEESARCTATYAITSSCSSCCHG